MIPGLDWPSFPPSLPPSLSLHASIISALALAAIIDRHYYTSPSHEARHFLGRFFGLVCMSVAAAARGIMGSVLAVAAVAEAEKEGRKRGNQMMRVCCSCCRRAALPPPLFCFPSPTHKLPLCVLNLKPHPEF